MNINTAFPSNYIKAADLQGRRAAVTISHLTMEDVGDDHKPVLYFEGKEKGLVLNKTNAAMIMEIAKTDETDAWKGVRIVLYPTKTDFQGKRVDAIRVDYPSTNGASAPKPEPVKAAAVTEDEIPFLWLVPLLLPMLSAAVLFA